MSPALIITTLILGLTIVGLFTELIPAGEVAMLAALALVVLGVVEGEALYRGFANPATITVGAMFVVSAALFHTGALDALGRQLGRLLDRSRAAALLTVCLSAGLLSAFVNNTTVVAIMLPLVVASARDAGVSASRLLMPLSFAAMIGGTCTLIGTSTNLIVDSFARREGLAPLTMFELAPVGLVIFAVTLVYLVVVGPWIVPERRAAESTSEAEVRSYVVDVEVTALPPGAPRLGDSGRAELGEDTGEDEDEDEDEDARVSGLALLDDLDCEALEIWREGEVLGGMLGGRVRVAPGDVLRLRCAPADATRLLAREGLRIVTAPEQASLGREDVILVEALVGPRSAFVGRRVDSLALRERLGAVVLGVRQRGELRAEHTGGLQLAPGDLLLLACDRDRVDELEDRGELILVSKISSSRPRSRRMPVAIAALLGVVIAAAAGLLNIAAAATAGAVLVLATGCVRLDEAVEAINWNVMLLLVGVLSLSEAMSAAGVDSIVAAGLVELGSGLDLRLAVGLIYVGTVLLSSILSNAATAALLTPVAIDVAAGLGVDPRPLIMAVAFGASTALLTPIGYQTNTMVYGAGHYRFSDYARVGGPLTLILIPVVAVLIPLIWPGTG